MRETPLFSQSFCAVSAILLACGLGAERAGAESVAQFQEWGLVCSGSECRLAQTLMSSERVWIATIMLHPHESRSEGRVAEVFVPPGVHFPSGLFVAAVPDDYRQAEWVSCVAMACEGVLRLDAEAEAQWRAATVAELRFRPSPTSPVASVDISLMGVTAGLAALDERQEGRVR